MSAALSMLAHNGEEVTMRGSTKIIVALTAVAGGVLVLGACDALRGLSGAASGETQVLAASEGRQNASRLIDTAGGKKLRVDVLQYTGAGTQHRCAPLGGPGIDPWPSRIGGPTIFTPNLFNIPSEYDWLATLGDTDYCLALRVPHEPIFPQFFTQIEFSLRAVNPCARGHIAGNDYFMTPQGSQADYPSNDDIVANRSLFDLNGGDVAVIVTGINFQFNPTNTTASMNFLGPTGWLVFLRDNAYRSGRFFNITGALKGGPPAFFDTPGTHDDGAFESVQVNGDHFDANSEPFGNVTAHPHPLTCAGFPTKSYAFLDLSNVDEHFVASPGEGGFAFVIRKDAFFGKGVVVNPNVPGPLPAPVTAGDILPIVPSSGYNEHVIPDITCPAPSDNTGLGVPGVHELGWSVFFVHSN